MTGKTHATAPADAVEVLEPMNSAQAQEYQRLRAHLSELRLSAAAESLTTVLDAAREAIQGAQIAGAVEMPSALAQVDAVLHQGGSGTAAACLAAGVGSVVVPTYTEQEFNGRALAEAGAGVVVPMSKTSSCRGSSDTYATHISRS